MSRVAKGKRKGSLKNGIFAGVIGNTNGIWRRDARGLTPLFIFTSKPPLYRARLDFDGIALNAANTHFPTEFKRAFEEMRAKGKA